MDDFELKGVELRRTLKDLNNINSWLGGNEITVNGVQKLLKPRSKKEKYSIVDVGCGDGASLRKLARWAQKKNYSLDLIGIDANQHAIEIAKELSKDYPNIRFKQQNIFDEVFSALNCDIILCTLTLHHFEDQEIIDLLNQFYSQAELGIVVNDLHRSRLAYFLFKAFCAVFVNNEIARKDGLTSILRGFKDHDLNRYKKNIQGDKHFINWKWAFRYQWIIQKDIL